jgi:hypothetical protein
LGAAQFILFIIRMIKSRWMIWAEYIACIGVTINSYNLSEGKKGLGRTRLSFEDDIKMYLKELRWDYELFYSGYSPVAGPCEHGNFFATKKNATNFLIRDY